ncbi:hypothetical protein BGZ61DRAFT_450390 [Ilyonectria robusta]|uniref:uncharacterized protein n=1 Tax=Ilyonectria robusta TaxID=1079257 RepID=UPI001E8CFA8D|nr:uncharacterized protein BGZ61DRAFT_450390 [Ilyonectria robusta]KAH8706718.1 hypothetical protein BGZ61DRAFT_450390 [Ilyonectria robusta]
MASKGGVFVWAAVAQAPTYGALIRLELLFAWSSYLLGVFVSFGSSVPGPWRVISDLTLRWLHYDADGCEYAPELPSPTLVPPAPHSAGFRLTSTDRTWHMLDLLDYDEAAFSSRQDAWPCSVCRPK